MLLTSLLYCWNVVVDCRLGWKVEQGEGGVSPKGRKLRCNQGLCQITGQRHYYAEFNRGPRERSPIILIFLSHGANSNVKRQHQETEGGPSYSRHPKCLSTPALVCLQLQKSFQQGNNNSMTVCSTHVCDVQQKRNVEWVKKEMCWLFQHFQEHKQRNIEQDVL